MIFFMFLLLKWMEKIAISYDVANNLIFRVLTLTDTCFFDILKPKLHKILNSSFFCNWATLKL